MSECGGIVLEPHKPAGSDDTVVTLDHAFEASGPLFAKLNVEMGSDGSAAWMHPVTVDPDGIRPQVYMNLERGRVCVTLSDEHEEIAAEIRLETDSGRWRMSSGYIHDNHMSTLRRSCQKSGAVKELVRALESVINAPDIVKKDSPVCAQARAVLDRVKGL
jgi:hypothetical protein